MTKKPNKTNKESHSVQAKVLNLSEMFSPLKITSLVFLQASHKDQKKIHKTMSSGDLGKVEVLRKTSSHDGR